MGEGTLEWPPGLREAQVRDIDFAPFSIIRDKLGNGQFGPVVAGMAVALVGVMS